MSVHTLHLIIVFCLVVAVFTAFLREWLSPDLVALSAMGVLLVSGVLTADETLSIFSNSAPVVISCMFVLSAGLERDRKSTRLNSSHLGISYAVFCLKKKSPTLADHAPTDEQANTK